MSVNERLINYPRFLSHPPGDTQPAWTRG